MADIKYTDAQKAAIFEENKNIIVSAAAGSGKTRVLVDRVINLITNHGADIDRMIIVTFTNKAAIEMKDKIRKELGNRINENPDNVNLKNQLKLLKHAHIQTLHSFASDMLREYFYFFDSLSPNFVVISESANKLLRQESIDEIFDREYEKASPDFFNFVHNFASSRDDKNAKNIILDTYDKLSAQIDPISWIDKMTKESFDLSDFKDLVKERMDEVISDINSTINYIKQSDLRDDYINLIREDFDKVNKINSLIDNDWEDFIKNLSSIKFSRMVSKRKGEETYQANIKSRRDSYKDSISTISKLVLNTNEDIFIKFNNLESSILGEIRRLTILFMETYKEKKRENSYLDFNDMEEEFIKLLNDENSREVIKSRFDYIFFDEYQDSNEIQNYIIDKLKADDNLFLVGDVKQSIYGFRRAEPRLFLDKLKSYQSESNKNSIRINLNENFRTDGDILHFDNVIFDHLMIEKISGIDYKNGGHRLNAAKEFDGGNPKTEVHILSKDVSEANHIASTINRLTREGYSYKDIVILLRSGSKSYIYENAFKLAGIPFFNDISKVTFNNVEVNFFKNILKLITNPKDDLVLLSVLQSDIYNFTEDDLAIIRLSNMGKSFYDALNSYDKDDEILVKINDFNTELIDLTYQSTLMSLYDFGNYVFEKTGYYDFLMARDRASDRRTNVEAFIDLMADFEANNDNGLYGFLSFVDDMQTHQTDNVNATRDLTENEDLVRIMTIHKSKGLEFPVVILADASKRFNDMFKRDNISFDDRLGIGINVADYENKIKLSSIKRDLINEKIDIENKREEMRILYVALTRPINKLIIIGDKSDSSLKKLYKRSDYLNLSTYMDWILSILSTDKSTIDIFEKKDYETNYFADELAVIKVDEDSDLGYYKDEDISSILKAVDFDDDLYKNFENLYERDYKYSQDIKEPLKKSATEISKNFDTYVDGYEPSSFNQLTKTIEFRKPSFIDNTKVYKPTEVGTIIHKVFQSLPYQKYDEEKLVEALQKNVENRKLKPDDLTIIENDKLLAFYNDPIIENLYEKAISIRTEESFLMKYDDIYVNGQIDVIFEFDDKIVLLDFKTDRIIREGFYNRQLDIYKKAINESLNLKGEKNIESIIYWYNFSKVEIV